MASDSNEQQQQEPEVELDIDQTVKVWNGVLVRAKREVEAMRDAYQVQQAMIAGLSEKIALLTSLLDAHELRIMQLEQQLPQEGQ